MSSIRDLVDSSKSSFKPSSRLGGGGSNRSAGGGNSDRNNSSRFLQNMNLAETDNSINGLLINPIKSGYFLKFSQSEFNAENMIYVLEIDRFKDLVCDHEAWNDDFNYKTIDQGIEDFGKTKKLENELVFGGNGSNEWPSNKIPYSVFAEHAKLIWDTYLANSAETQICMPARVLSNTIHRLEYLHLYGHKVFDETILDPIKTLNADVLPRFLTSPHFKTMTRRLSELYPLPSKEQLELKLPSKSACMHWEEERLTVDNLRELSMVELFHDKLLYKEFLTYSKKIYSEENVYLARAISIFKCHFAHGTKSSTPLAPGKFPPEAEEQAWLIFRFFVAPNSVYECGMNQRRRKDIMHNLASPNKDMFSGLEKSIHRLIRSQYVNFSFTREFRAIPGAIVGASFDKQLAERAAKLAVKCEERRRQQAQDASCLGMGKYVHEINNNIINNNKKNNKHDSKKPGNRSPGKPSK